MYYVYILVSESGERYIGFTSDLERRLQEHSRLKGYTKGREWNLVYYEAYVDKELALRRERQLKRHGGVRTALFKRLGLIGRT